MTMDLPLIAAPTDDPVLNRALAAKARAEARHALALAKKVEAEGRKATIEADAAERDEREKLADWRYQHIYHLYGGISEATVRIAMDRLNVMSQLDPGCDIEIVLNSPGGDAFWGMCLFDYICHLRAKGHRITTVGEGAAMSMAGILLQAGDWRVLGKQAWVVIHQVKSEAVGDPTKIHDVAKWADDICERVKMIFVERSKGKLTSEYIQEQWDRGKDWILHADKAFEFGIVDEIR